MQKERMQKERMQKERMQKERMQKERMQRERMQRERMQRERMQRERMQRERMEQACGTSVAIMAAADSRRLLSGDQPGCGMGPGSAAGIGDPLRFRLFSLF
jgi:hypothetical protein